jgi:hypothetical protein
MAFEVEVIVGVPVDGGQIDGIMLIRCPDGDLR